MIQKHHFIHIFILTAFLMGAAFIFNGKAVAKTSETVDALKVYFDDLYNAKNINGAILVAKDGVKIYSGGYGYADVENQLSNTENTIFPSASISKMFVAMGIMMLVEEGLLSVDDTIDTYVPEIKVGSQVTVRQCLSNSSGLRGFLKNSDLWKNRAIQHAPDQILPYFKDFELEFAPGAQFEYSNSNYITLGIIIERISGKDLNTFLTEKIFTPLNMTRTYYDRENDDVYTNVAKLYKTIEPVKEAAFFHQSIVFSAGGIFSTIEDLFKWTKALKTEKFVSSNSLAEIFTPGLGNYGYGWYIDTLTVGGVTYNQTWHWGSYFGASGYVTRLVDEDLTIIILENLPAETPDDWDSIIEKVVSIVLQGGY